MRAMCCRELIAIATSLVVGQSGLGQLARDLEIDVFVMLTRSEDVSIGPSLQPREKLAPR